MNKQQKEFLQTLNDTEILLCPYGAVGIVAKNDKYGFVYCGDFHKIDNSNYELIKDAYYMTEYGTTDFNKILKMEGF